MPFSIDRMFQKVIEDGNEICGGFSCSGLCLCGHVFANQRLREGFCLYGSAIMKCEIVYRVHDLVRKFKIVKPRFAINDGDFKHRTIPRLY